MTLGVKPYAFHISEDHPSEEWLGTHFPPDLQQVIKENGYLHEDVVNFPGNDNKVE